LPDICALVLDVSGTLKYTPESRDWIKVSYMLF
jgi:hypothetical protein